MKLIFAGLFLLGLVHAQTNSLKQADANQNALLEDIDDQSQQAQQDQKKLPTVPPQQKADVQRDYQSHVDKIVSIGQSQPQNQQVSEKAGEKLFELGEDGQAQPFADQSVALARQSGDAKALHDSLVTQARIRFDLKDYSGVVADADELLKRDPADQAALRLRGMAANRTTAGARGPTGGISPAPEARRPDARAPVAAVRGAAPNAARPTVLQPSAQALLAKAVQESQSVDSQHLAEQAAGQIGLDPASAALLLDKAVTLDPRNAEAYALRARAVLAEGGSAQAAFDDADRAVGLDAKEADAYEARAQAALKLGRPTPLALADLKAAAELDPSFGPEYEKALAQYGASGESAAAAAGISGSARAGWFGRLPERLKTDRTLQLLCAAAAVVVAAWLALLFWPKRGDDRPQ